MNADGFQQLPLVGETAWVIRSRIRGQSGLVTPLGGYQGRTFLDLAYKSKPQRRRSQGVFVAALLSGRRFAILAAGWAASPLGSRWRRTSHLNQPLRRPSPALL